MYKLVFFLFAVVQNPLKKKKNTEYNYQHTRQSPTPHCPRGKKQKHKKHLRLWETRCRAPPRAHFLFFPASGFWKRLRFPNPQNNPSFSIPQKTTTNPTLTLQSTTRETPNPYPQRHPENPPPTVTTRHVTKRKPLLAPPPVPPAAPRYLASGRDRRVLCRPSG